MPSGHSQFATFSASVLLQHAKPGLYGITFVVGWAGLLLLSRTKYGGRYISVGTEEEDKDGGERRLVITGCHTVPQVVTGAVIGLVAAHFGYSLMFSL